MQATDTIVALSTPPGRSGIGVIRMSGDGVLPLLRALLLDDGFNPEPNHVSLKSIHDPESGAVIDRALITYFKSPQSFTGEDIVELSCHGSPPLLLHILDLLLLRGARTADPGEFTLRALSNGRLNLSQAEAVRDLIDARTFAGVRQAARQLGGELSARLQPIKDSLIEIIVPLESSLEFVEDDLPEEVTREVAQKLTSLRIRLQDLASTFRAGRLLKDGLRVALVGRPNVGKSSLFNGLLVNNRAIVTDVPGTTRDSLSESVNISDIPILLTDTAGVRSSPDRIEQLGIERTHQAIIDADFVVVVLDGSQPATIDDETILANAKQSRYLIALNKSDLLSFNFTNVSDLVDGARLISVSAKTGEGLDVLRAAIIEPFIENEIHETSFLITNARHYDLLRRATESLRRSEELTRDSVSEELLLTGLYDCLRFLGEITGETTPDDVLSRIFSTFCIGK